MTIRRYLMTCFAAPAMLAAGCGLEPETIETLQGVVQTVTAGPAVAEPVEQDSESDATFRPAYPDRVDPFSFPETAPVSDESSTSITSVAQVEILGFAEVDEPRVFLRTRDQIKSLKVDDVVDGVEVVSISPPTARLRMGTLVWTATMYEGLSRPTE